MCIVLLTTAHPQYALIVLDNRDEFILRPTSRPHWWTAKQPAPDTDGGANQAVNGASGAAAADGSQQELPVQEILSSRDLHRAERGTWLGINKAGHFAVLTNYQETDPSDDAHPVRGARSRGAMVTSWLTAHPSEPTSAFVQRMLDGGVKGVGGFSLICGKLRRQRQAGRAGLEPLAIISNRNDSADQVPWICDQEGEVHGLSNACFLDRPAWPKVEHGMRLLKEAVEQAVSDGSDEERLVETLFQVLDTDTLPASESLGFRDYMPLLKHSIFIPPIGDAAHKLAMEEAANNGKTTTAAEIPQELNDKGRPDGSCQGFEAGMYGTQRQTVLLVDWDGNVTYRERALWDDRGNKLPRGAGDTTFKFKVEGWDE